MTGIDRLRELADEYEEHSWSEAGRERGRLIRGIADRIEHDFKDERDRWDEELCEAQMDKTRVTAVYLEMNKHVSGVEGADDSPVARWARELREALDGEEHDHADERDAIAWVREHGGLDAVKEEWDHSRNLKRSLETAQAKVERQQRHIESLQGKLSERRDKINVMRAQMAEMRPRLMPEGMEWPRFEDGEPVKFGDMALIDGEADMVEAVQLWIHGKPVICGDGGSQQLEKGERVKRLAPKVLDADGVEIRVGDEVFVIETGKTHHVTIIDHIGKRFKSMEQMGDDATWLDPICFTHRAPVLAADGKPLREGETVWDTKGNGPYIIDAIDGDEVVRIKGNDLDYFGADFTHERPVADTWERLEEDANKGSCDYFGCDANGCHGCPAYSWNVARGGSGCGNAKMRDLVRRAKRLAGEA